jgi:S1-C subfamily serine protease
MSPSNSATTTANTRLNRTPRHRALSDEPARVTQGRRRMVPAATWRVSRGAAGEPPPTVGPPRPRGFLGVRLDMLEPGAGRGAEVVQTVRGSAAASAGVNPCDRIVFIGSRRLTTNEDLVDALASLRPGDDVDLAWRTPIGTAHVTRVRLTKAVVESARRTPGRLP